MRPTNCLSGNTKSRRTGVTLLELLLTIVVVTVLAAAAITVSSSDAPTALNSTAQTVASHLAWCRSLAVSNASRYEIRCDTTGNRLILRHSGTRIALDVVPDGRLHWRRGTDTENILDLDNLPHIGVAPKLVWVALEPSKAAASAIEFGPLGSTSATETTTLWLGASGNNVRWYIPIRINPVTGLANVGEMQTSAPGYMPTATAEAAVGH